VGSSLFQFGLYFGEDVMKHDGGKDW
jgi:hypothetical protein